MTYLSKTAVAHPNIAFIKYWGNRDAHLRLPLNGSLSMCLADLTTTTTVRFGDDYERDSFYLEDVEQSGEKLERVGSFLNVVRAWAGLDLPARVSSSNSFPAGAGIASSASAFSALALAASRAAGLELTEKELSRLARLGSGSACRSIPGGFAEWLMGSGDADSYAVQIAPPDHWDLLDLVVIVDPEHKKVGSTPGHATAQTSPLNTLRVSGAPTRLEECRQAILRRDFERLAPVVEDDSNWMHVVMRTSTPPLVYWTAATQTVLWHVLAWRKRGHAVCATVDAGPNVHVITLESERAWVLEALRELPGVRGILSAHPGGAARLAADE